jgi:ribosome assembly protein 1
MAPVKTANAARGTMRGWSAHKVVSFTIRAVPIPPSILDFILDNLMTLKTLIQDKRDQQIEEEEERDIDLHGDVIRKSTISPGQFWDVFAEKCKDIGGEWKDVAAKTWAFGPQKSGGCLLIDARNHKTIASLVFS